MARPDRIRNSQLLRLMLPMPPWASVKNTMPQAITSTTPVRMAVARLELTPSMPTLARIEVSAANTAEPSADTRDGQQILRSRIGLEAMVEVIPPEMDIYDRFRETKRGSCDVIIVDECQFLTEDQIDQLRTIVNDENIPVMCFGLRTDFQTRLFPGSRRLMEVADSILEIKTICDCGTKRGLAMKVAERDENGNLVLVKAAHGGPRVPPVRS